MFQTKVDKDVGSVCEIADLLWQAGRKWVVGQVS